jgi:hypothetical protein
VCDEVGIHAGLVDLATLSVANLYLAGAPSGDWLIVHIRPEYTSIAIMRGSDLIFFRTRAEGDPEPLADWFTRRPCITRIGCLVMVYHGCLRAGAAVSPVASNSPAGKSKPD